MHCSRSYVSRTEDHNDVITSRHIVTLRYKQGHGAFFIKRIFRFEKHWTVCDGIQYCRLINVQLWVSELVASNGKGSFTLSESEFFFRFVFTDRKGRLCFQGRLLGGHRSLLGGHRYPGEVGYPRGIPPPPHPPPPHAEVQATAAVGTHPTGK